MAAVVADVGGEESESGGRELIDGADELARLLRFECRMESTVGRVVSSSGVSAIGTGGLDQYGSFK